MIIKHHTNEVKSWHVNQLKDAVQGKSSLVGTSREIERSLQVMRAELESIRR